MSKYKTGDKVVMEIISADQDEIKTYSVSGVNDDWRWCLPQNLLERYTEPLSTYTEPLEAKIRRQAAEITRLLRENAELKEESKRNYTINIEMARAEGRSEAWDLARKIAVIPKDGGYGGSKLIEIFNTALLNEIFNLTYSEAATKVAQWEKAKDEIIVGDIVHIENIHGTDGIVTYVNGCRVTLMLNNGVAVYRDKNEIEKTGRHIDIDSFLKQIGEE